MCRDKQRRQHHWLATTVGACLSFYATHVCLSKERSVCCPSFCNPSCLLVTCYTSQRTKASSVSSMPFLQDDGLRPSSMYPMCALVVYVCPFSALVFTPLSAFDLSRITATACSL
uniref:Secreted protein n=1 Tax=Ditylenchus dipsaci TaxID=166011 RepID=A0A915D8M7_9BILA